MTKNEEDLFKLSLYFVTIIYRYLGNTLTKEELKEATDKSIQDEALKESLYHRYILKDTYQNMMSNAFDKDLEVTDLELDDDDLFIKEQ